MASTDGDCLIWPEEVDAGDVDDHGALLRELDTTPVRAQSNWLHHLSDRTPHASIAATQAHYRQFFRLVGPNIFGWYLQHSTPNPLGVLPGPGVPIIHTSKF
jgi:hypothetical protein